MTRPHAPHVIVIGAGIAGLTAAYTLAAAGASVRVLEASGRVGGRMTTDLVDGFVVDRGAQFMSSEYRLLLSLAAELGLASAIRETSPWSAVVRGGKVRRTRADNPLHALASGLLRPAAWARLGWQTWKLRRALGRLPLGDYSRWTAFDRESVSSWAGRVAGASVTEYLYEPMLQGFYFQAPEQTSASLALVLSGFGFRRARTLACARGIGALPEAMAARLDVALHAPVDAVESDGDSVVVTSGASTMRADYAVLAVPAVRARDIYAPADDTALRLLATPYSAALNISVMTGAGFALPAELKDVYGLLVPRLERERIAGIGIEGNKHRACAPRGQLLNIMLSDAASRSLMALPDDAVVRTVMPEAERFFPGLAAHVRATRIYRWPHAEPCSPVGRARDVDRYRRNCAASAPRVLLAGDYMSMPYTEGAAESGKWAAGRIAAAGTAPAS